MTERERKKGEKKKRDGQRINVRDNGVRAWEKRGRESRSS